MPRKSKVHQLLEIINAVRGSIYWKDTKGRYLGCNKYMLRMAGLSKLSEIIGKRDAELPWKAIANELFQTDQKIIQDKSTLEIEESPTLFNQKQKIFLTTKTPLFDDSNNIIGVIGISMDITARKEAEEELKVAKEIAETASQAKTEFLRNMRHDLRTPFSGILSMAQLLEADETDPIKKGHLKDIAESAEALLNHLNEILEFVEVESGQVPIIEKAFDIYEAVEEVYRIMLPSASQKQLNFKLTIDKKLPRHLVGDAVRMQRILINLITNAIKFTERGYVKVAMNWKTKLDGKGVVQFIIEDTGIGIPKDKQHIIFERFNRLTSSYSGIYAGKGLGLRIVKQFLDEIDGQLQLESVPEKGTIFNILIPYKVNLFDEMAQEKSGKNEQEAIVFEGTKDNPLSHSTDGKPKNTKKKTELRSKILLVEDSSIAQKIVKIILNRLDYEVDIAANGKAALRLIKEHRYDFIFMDIGLPDINGCAVAKIIRSNRLKRIAQIPIVALTGHVENDEKCLDAGMNAVITKPLTEKGAKSTLDSFISKRLERKLIKQVKQTSNI